MVDADKVREIASSSGFLFQILIEHRIGQLYAIEAVHKPSVGCFVVRQERT